MNKPLLLALVLGAFLVPVAVASSPNQHPITKHTVSHPKPVHATNPYLKHPNHKAKRGRHKKI